MNEPYFIHVRNLEDYKAVLDILFSQGYVFTHNHRFRTVFLVLNYYNNWKKFIVVGFSSQCKAVLSDTNFPNRDAGKVIEGELFIREHPSKVASKPIVWDAYDLGWRDDMNFVTPKV